MKLWRFENFRIKFHNLNKAPEERNIYRLELSKKELRKSGIEMADTYSKIYIHVIFAVKGRHSLISSKWDDELYSFITGIVINKGQKLIRINGMPDHLHLLIGIKPDLPLSDLVRDIKSNSSRFINDKKWINGKFEWQQGFGAFSLSHSQLTSAINYIKQQKEHHKKRTFREEYENFLKKYDVEYKTKYLFDEPESP